MKSESLNLSEKLLTSDRQAASMAARISRYLTGRSGISLVEMARDIPGFNGNSTWGSEENNVILWADMSASAIAAMKQLLSTGQIIPTPTNTLVYAYDGGAMDMPIATSVNRRYARPHWLPVVFADNREAA